MGTSTNEGDSMNEEREDRELDALLAGGLFGVAFTFAMVGAIILLNLG